MVPLFAVSPPRSYHWRQVFLTTSASGCAIIIGSFVSFYWIDFLMEWNPKQRYYQYCFESINHNAKNPYFRYPVFNQYHIFKRTHFWGLICITSPIWITFPIFWITSWMSGLDSMFHWKLFFFEGRFIFLVWV